MYGGGREAMIRAVVGQPYVGEVDCFSRPSSVEVLLHEDPFRAITPELLE